MVLRSNDRERSAVWLKIGVLLLIVASMVLGGASRAGAAEVFPMIIPLPDDWQPEGIATGRGTSFYAGSLANGAIWKGDLRTGEGYILNPGDEGRRIAGLKVDVRTNYVFAAGTGSGMAFVFDGDTGALLATYQLTTETATFINDVVITRDAAYFTDSQQPVIYKLPLGPGGQLPDQSEVVAIPLSGDFAMVAGFNVNGIDATPNGKTLVIVQSATGKLFTVDPNTGHTEEIDLHGGSVPNGDGILLQGKTLYVVQNRLNQIAVIDLDLRTLSGHIVRLITDPAFEVPTTIAQHGSSLYAVNARFGMPPGSYEVVRVNK